MSSKGKNDLASDPNENPGAGMTVDFPAPPASDSQPDPSEWQANSPQEPAEPAKEIEKTNPEKSQMESTPGVNSVIEK